MEFTKHALNEVLIVTSSFRWFFNLIGRRNEVLTNGMLSSELATKCCASSLLANNRLSVS